VIELLLAHGADVHIYATNGTGALHIAAFFGNVNCARALIAAGADVNRAHCEGQSSLHMAISEHSSAVVQLLLEHGATAVTNSLVATNCKHGEHCCTTVTALMLCNDAGTLKVLLAAAADACKTTMAGDTCLHVAARHNYKAAVICLLIKAGVDLHAVNNSGKTAAQLAHDRGHSLIEQLLNRAAQQGH
jgi:ankyrin repeat domain-containing protein 6